MSEEKKGVEKDTKNQEKPELKMRQIIIETDGSKLRIVKDETAGSLELIAVLNAIINAISNSK